MKSCCDEYCSTHGCNQGRDCPVRVARIGRKDYAREALPPSPTYAYLRHLAKWMLIVLAVVTLTPLAVSLALAKAIEPPATDCGALIARLQPNVPAHVLIKCGGRV